MRALPQHKFTANARPNNTVRFSGIPVTFNGKKGFLKDHFGRKKGFSY